MTNNEERRRELFDFSRCLFYKDLMPSVEELIINYINNGLPIIEERYKLKSSSVFSGHWKKACQNLSYFFEPDLADLKKHTEYYRFLGEYFVKTNNGYVLEFDKEISINGKEVEREKIQNAFQELISELSDKQYKEQEQYIHLSFQLVLIIFCYGINFNQQITEEFWKKIGIENLNDRIGYAVKEIPDLFYRGPISNISKMILLQANSKSTRGVYFDALHSIYITYSDFYFSDDEHFSNLKKSIKDPNMFKIKKVSEVI